VRLQLSRDDYRERRRKQLGGSNYLNLPAAVAAAAARLEREATRSLPPREREEEEQEGATRRRASSPSPASALPLSFSRNSRAVRCSISHFQLRNLLYTPSLHDAFVVHGSRLLHWDSATRERIVVLDLSGSNNNGFGFGGVGGRDDDDENEWRAARARGLPGAAPFANWRVPLPPLPAPPPWSGAFPMLGTAAAVAAGMQQLQQGQLQQQGQARRVQVGTAAVGLGLAALGGFNGEIAVVPTRLSPSSSSSRGSSSNNNTSSVGMRVTTSDNGITNGLEVSGGPGRGSSTLPRVPDFGEEDEKNSFSSSSSPSTTSVFAANNDGLVRAFDASTWQRTLCVDCGWAVNFATASPDGALLAAVGDDPAARLLDPRCCGASGGGSSSSSAAINPTQTKKSGVAVLHGHLDFSFAAAWHPSGLLLATGNQDATTRVWDLRNTREALHVLRSELGAVRSLRFSPDGALLAAAEPADFVRVYDCHGESGGGLGGRGGGGRALRLRRSSSSPRRRRDEEEEMREADAGDDEEDEEAETLSLPFSSSSSSSFPLAATCGACSGGGCPRCVDLALRHQQRLQMLRGRRQLALEEQQRQRKQQRLRQQRLRRNSRRRGTGIDDDGDDQEEEEDDDGDDEEGGGLPLLGESTEDDDENENENAEAANNNAADNNNNNNNNNNSSSSSSSPLPRGPFETAQTVDFFGEIAGISWSPCGTRLSVAVADATYSSLLQFDRI